MATTGERDEQFAQLDDENRLLRQENDGLKVLLDRRERQLWWALVEWEASMSLLYKEPGQIGDDALSDIERIRTMRIRLWPTPKSREKFLAEQS